MYVKENYTKVNRRIYTYIKSQDCISVKGYLRSIIYDLGRKKYYFIPNSFNKLLDSPNKLNEVIENISNNSLYDEYKEFLMDNEIVISVPIEQSKLFKQINNDWKYHALIMRCFLKFDEKSRDIRKILKKIEENDLYELNVIIDYYNLFNFLKILDTFFFHYVSIYVHIETNTNIKEILLLMSKNDRNNFIIISDTIDIKIEDNIKNIICQKQLPFNQIIKQNKFYVTNSLFFEANLYNVYYNKTIFICEKGFLYNYAWNSKSINKVLDYNFQLIDNDPYFNTLWQLPKSKIKICNICEFRNMCIDNRVPIKIHNKELYFFNKECTYNPYIAKWKDEDGFVPVSECGTFSQEIGFVHDEKKIKRMNKQIWG
jgi:hypothetical protein